MKAQGSQSKENTSAPRKPGVLTEERRALHAESAKYRNLNLPKIHFVWLASGYKEASIWSSYS